MGIDDTLVCRTDGEANAQQIKAFLEANDIPCHFRGESARTTHGFTLDGLGVVEIHVEVQYVEKAKRLIRQAEAGELHIEDGDWQG
jgi:hypothetical protein